MSHLILLASRSLLCNDCKKKTTTLAFMTFYEIMSFYCKLFFALINVYGDVLLFVVSALIANSISVWCNYYFYLRFPYIPTYFMSNSNYIFLFTCAKTYNWFKMSLRWFVGLILIWERWIFHIHFQYPILIQGSHSSCGSLCLTCYDQDKA